MHIISTLTPFPHLCSSAPEGHTIQPKQSRLDVHLAAPTSSHSVYLAWARLLEAYTKSETVTFETDHEKAICWSLDNPEKINTRATFSNNSAALTTGVFLQFPTHTRAKFLWLYHDIHQGRSLLLSSGHIPETHLHQLGSQVENALYNVLISRNELSSKPRPHSPALSIINPYPKRLQSFDRLHEIVAQKSQSSQIATRHVRQGHTPIDLSYTDLDERSRRLAVRLQKVLLSPEGQQIIPILTEQTPDLYIAQLAISRIGAAFCPIALDAPTERIKYILEDVKAGMVLTTTPLKSKLTHLNVSLVLIDEESSDGGKEILEKAGSPGHLCYIMYTSGSTGRPKGVAVSHESVLQSLSSHEKHIPSFNRFLQFAAPTFDVSIFEIYFTFMRGATLVCADRGFLLTHLPTIINEFSIDAAELTPTIASSLIRTRAKCSGLRFLLTIGEMLSEPIIQEFGGNHSQNSMLFAMYGPTEASIHCSLQPYLHSSSVNGNIGKTLDTVSAFIISEDPTNSEILPIGHIGELVLGGHQLADGYLNQESQTDSVFINNQEFGLLYRTGDRARFLPEGIIECLGRVQEGQVKLRGQRMELAEVEAAALKCSSVSLAVALIIDEHLILFCSIETHNRPSRKEIELVCSQWLPRFAVPSKIILLNELPRLASGKVDKKHLRKGYQNSEHSLAFNEPLASDEMESIINDSISEILGRRLSQSTQFTEAGLDSLKAIQLASRLCGAGFSISGNDVVLASDIHTLAERLRCNLSVNKIDPTADSEYTELCHSLEDSLDKSQLHPIDGGSASAQICPCSPIQNAILAANVQNPLSYWNYIELEINTSVATARSIWMRLAQVNPILRSGFVYTGHVKSAFAQVIWPELETWQICETLSPNTTPLDNTKTTLLRPLLVQITPVQQRSKLQIQIHHALYDGWSWDCLISDMAKLVRNDNIPERPDYQSYVSSIYQYLGSEKAAEDADYWREYLTTCQGAPFPRISPMKTKGKLQITRCSAIHIKTFYSLSNKLRIHPQSIFIAALSLLFSKYTSTEEILLEVVAAGRSLAIPNIESIIGPCITTLPLRLVMDGSMVASDFMRHIQHTLDSIIQHGNLPLNQIKQVSRVAPSNPPFEILFAWQESVTNNKDVTDLVKQHHSQDYVDQKLLLEVEPLEDEVSLKATFDSSCISEDQMTMLFQQMDIVFDTLIFKPNEILDQNVFDNFPSSLLSMKHTQPNIENIVPLEWQVEAWAEKDPQRLAIELILSNSSDHKSSTKLTYAELNTRADDVASWLAKEGIRPSDVVAVFMNKTIELYISALAVIKIGAAYLPVSPETPVPRVADILQVSKSKFCLVQNDSSPVITGKTSCNIINVDDVAPPFPNFLGKRNVDLNDTAYIIFTSGSTGKPKGVPITQRNLASNLAVLDEIYPPSSASSRMLQSSSQSFDLSMFEIFFAWCRGMCLVSARKDLLFHDIEKLIQTSKVTQLSLTPTVAGMIDPLMVPTVETLVTAGEPMTEYLQAKWGGEKLYNGYGPSETTNICTVKPHMTSEFSSAFIGLPFRNTSAFVVESDSFFGLMPKGAIGEICIGGDQVFNGYLREPELNKSKLIQHPTYGRIFRSGDLGFMLPDGALMCVGRIDDQVKIRGLRVELSEIDHTVQMHERVSQCVTLLFKDVVRSSDYLTSFWVPSAEHDLRLDNQNESSATQSVIHDIFNLILSRLPEYMCPQHLMPIKDIPRTPNGKVDRSNLERLVSTMTSEARSKFSRAYEEESPDDLDLGLAEATDFIVKEFSAFMDIPHDKIKNTTSFYNFGLDSVSAIAFSRRLRKTSGFAQVEVSSILRYATPQRLSKHLRDTGQGVGIVHPGTVSVEDLFGEAFKTAIYEKISSIEAILPCTSLQVAMLSVSDSSDSTAYQNSTSLDVRGSVEGLKLAWEQVMLRQAVLRTYFVSTSQIDHPYAQVVVSHADLPWEELSSDQVKESQFSLKHNSSFIDSLVLPYKLNIQKSDGNGKVSLRLHIHHALYDGIAFENLLHEVEQIYLGKDLPDSVPFYPFLQRALNIDYRSVDDYWKRHLSDYEPSPPLSLTGKSIASKKQLTGYGIFKQPLDFSLSRLQRAAMESSSTLLSFCHAAWSKVLHTFHDSVDICFGNVLSGRTLPIDGLDRLVAPCFNTLPVRVELTKQLTNRGLVNQLNRINAEHLPHQLDPLRRIQSRFSEDGLHLFDTLFILQNSPLRLENGIWSMEAEDGIMNVCLVQAIQITFKLTKCSFPLFVSLYRTLIRIT